jgi:hypothetical protein
MDVRNISIVSMQQLAAPAGSGASGPPAAAPAPQPAAAAAPGPQGVDWATVGKGIGKRGQLDPLSVLS